MVKNSIVLIADRVKHHLMANLFSTDLEKVDDIYFDEVYSALKMISKNVVHYNSLKHFIKNIDKHKNDIVVSIWSGEKSRNRKSLVPSVCEAYGIKYIGPDTYVQTLSQDKVLSKEYCLRFGINSPEYVAVYKQQDLSSISHLKLPMVVKPIYEGGSIGISNKNIVFDYDTGKELGKKLLSKYESVMFEENIDGFEVSVVLVGTKKEILLKGACKIEIEGQDFFVNQIWGYQDKKIKFAKETLPADDLIDNLMWEKFENLFHTLVKVDFLRIDGRIKDNCFKLLELSADPYLGLNGCFSSIFINKGHSLSEMFEILITTSLKNDLC